MTSEELFFLDPPVLDDKHSKENKYFRDIEEIIKRSPKGNILLNKNTLNDDECIELFELYTQAQKSVMQIPTK